MADSDPIGLMNEVRSARESKIATNMHEGGTQKAGPLSKKKRDQSDDAPKYHRGGKVRKTGLARLRKGEQVLTKGQMKRLKARSGKRR